MKFGTLEGVQESVNKLRNLLQALGQKGTLSLTPSVGQRCKFEISESLQIELQTPANIHYEFQVGVLVVKFEKPYPVVHYKMFTKDVTFVEITTERIDVSLAWSPDGYFEVLS